MLDRNFKCFGAVTFAWFIGFCAMLAARVLSFGVALIWTRLNKKNKKPAAQFLLWQPADNAFILLREKSVKISWEH